MSKHVAIVAMLITLCSCSSAERRIGNESAASEEIVENVMNETVENTVDPAANAAENVAENAVNVAENAANGGEEINNAANAVDSGDNDEWCAVARATMTVAQCQSLAIQRDSLEEGVVAFNPPREMIRGVATRVVLAIGAKTDETEVVGAAGGQPTAPRVSPVRIGRYMSAALSGSAFTIMPVGDPERDLGLSTSEQWEWDVTPTAQGRQSLQVRIETLAQDRHGNRTRIKLYQSPAVTVSVKVADREIVVEDLAKKKETVEGWTGLLKSISAWLIALAGVIAAAGLVVWRVRRLGQKPEDAQDEDKPPPTV